MAKSKTPAMPRMPMWKPPSPKERVAMAAKCFAEVVAEAHPATKQIRDRVLRGALQAAKVGSRTLDHV